jgi:CheY-like chemotaxis protein
VAGSDPIRVLIVDDHPAVRRGLRTFLELTEDIDVVGVAADGLGVADLVAEGRPDVVLLDMVLPGLDGLGVLAELRERGLDARVLVVTSFTDRRSVLPAIRAGARGYLSKDVEPEALASAVRSVHAGHLLLEPELTATCWRWSPTGGRTGRAPGRWSCPRRRSRPTCRASCSSSGWPTARRPRFTRCVPDWCPDRLVRPWWARRPVRALRTIRADLAGLLSLPTGDADRCS